MESVLTLEMVKQALSLPLPGRQAQIRMSSRPRPGDGPWLDESAFKDGAVLILLYPMGGRLHFPLTKRTTTVASHKGHISLPGGAREGAETLAETALRESLEEIGVPLEKKNVIGALSVIHVPVSGYRVAPFVAEADSRPDFRLDPDEVEELIEFPLDLLLHEDSVEQEWRTHKGQRMLVPYYRHGKHKIWGATAMILSEFSSLLAKTIASRPP